MPYRYFQSSDPVSSRFSWSFLGDGSPASKRPIVLYLDAPVLIAPADSAVLDDYTPAFSWGAVFNADSYEIEIGIDPDFAFSDSQTVTVTSYTPVDDLPDDETIYWRVRARVGPTVSAWSAVRSFTFLALSAPVLSSPTDGIYTFDYTPTLSWGAVTNADGYEVQIATDSGFSTVVASGSPSGTSFTPSGDLTYASVFYWRVRAVTNEIVSAYSATRTFKLYILVDEFTDTLSAGAVNGTAANGTGQTRVVTDSVSKLSISPTNGLEIIAMTGAGDPGIWYPQITRQIGMAVGWRVKPVSGTLATPFGWDINQAGGIQGGAYFVGGVLRSLFSGNQRDMLGAVFTNGTTYDCIAILRNPGIWILINGGVYSDWSLGLVGFTSTENYYPAGGSQAGTFTGTVYARRVYAARLMEWSTQYANATERKATSTPGDTISAAAGDALIEHTIVAATGVTQELMVRRTDDNNCVIIRMDQGAGTIKVYEKNAGVETEKTGGTTTQTWTNGVSYRIFVSLYGTVIRVTVDATGKNNATGSGFNASVTGVKVSHAGSNLIAWPITPPAAALAELDAFFPT